MMMIRQVVACQLVGGQGATLKFGTVQIRGRGKIPGKPTFRGGFVQSGGSIPAILCLAQASAGGGASVLGPQLCS